MAIGESNVDRQHISNDPIALASNSVEYCVVEMGTAECKCVE